MKMDNIFTFLCAHVVTGSDILVDSNFLPVSYLSIQHWHFTFIGERAYSLGAKLKM